MTKTDTTADSIAHRFIAQPEPILGEPTRPTIVQLRDCVYANATQIPSSLGGGNQGYLGAVLPAAEYALIPNTVPFVTPVNPGNVLAIALAGTAMAIADQLRTHEEQTRQWNEFTAVMQALRKLIVDCVEDKYIVSLKHKYSRYNAIHPTTLLTHLFDNYGQLTPEELSANDERMSEPWNTTDPFEVLAERMQECVDLASEAGAPIPEATLLNRTVRLVAKTGEFTEELKAWHNKATAAKTWDNFKPFMIKAYRVNRQVEQNNMRAGGAAMSAEQITQIFGVLQAQANAAAASTNNSTNNDVLKAIENLKKELRAEFKQDMKTYCQQTTPGQAKPYVRKPGRDQGGYCWTHGYHVVPSHTSATCNRKATGHKDEATRNNPMGGSAIGKP
jgi:hypothetical protein